MNDFSTEVVQKYFKMYYETTGSFPIKKLPERELAFSVFGKGGMIRHTSFSDQDDLKKYVRDNTPQHFYYSSAYYQEPAADMDNKRWMAADLVFDIDGDHIEGADQMSYSEMLATVKGELMKLLFLLKDDLNVNERDMEIVFSGSRGYHVHVYSLFESLESQERREIVDYITGRCLSPEFKLSEKTRWQQRLNETKENLIMISKTKSNWKEKLAKETEETSVVPDKKDKGFNSYIDRNARKIAIKRYSSKIDEPVTIDIHRLIRTPNSLHGKSGLLVKVIEPRKVESFNPLSECTQALFSEQVQVNITKKITIELNEEKTTLQEGNVTIPVQSAIFAVLKGSAEFPQ